MTAHSRRTFLVKMTAVLNAAVMPLHGAHAVGKEHLVEIRGFVFAPDKLEVRVGDRITWINRDIAPHTATALDGSWDTGELVKGQSATLTVTEGMSSDYFCAYHPHMEGQLKLNG